MTMPFELLDRCIGHLKDFILLALLAILIMLQPNVAEASSPLEITGHVGQSSFNEQDNVLVVAGTTSSNVSVDQSPELSAARSQIYLLRQDADGSVTTFNFQVTQAAGDLRVIDLVQGLNGDIALVGSYTGSHQIGEIELEHSSGRDAFVMIFDSSLKPISSFVVASSGLDAITDIAFSPTGYVIVGYSTRPPAIFGRQPASAVDTQLFGFLASLDDNGDLSWAHTLDGQIVQNVSVNSVGEIAAAGWRYGPLATSGQVNEHDSRAVSFATRFSAGGDLLWTRLLGGSSDCDEFTTSILVTETAEVFASGTYCGIGQYGTDILPPAHHGLYLARIDVDGELKWIRRLLNGAGIFGSTRYATLDMDEIEGGNVAILANVGPDAYLERLPVTNRGQMDPVLFISDEDANIVHMSSHGGPKNDFALGLEITQDDRILLYKGNAENAEIKSVALAGLYNDFQTTLTNYPFVQRAGLQTMLNFGRGGSHSLDLSGGVPGGDLLVIHSLGVGVGHSIIALMDDDLSNPQVKATFGLWSTNSEQGFHASQGMQLSLSTGEDYERYVKDLVLFASGLTPDQTLELLESDGGRLIFRLSGQQSEALQDAIVEENQNLEGLTLNYGDFRTHGAFYKRLNSSFARVLESVGLQYRATRSQNAPQAIFSFWPTHLSMVANDSWRSVNDLYFYGLLPTDEYSGGLRGGLPDGAGAASFNRRRVLLPSGQETRWRGYVGQWSAGRFHGAGRLEFEIKNRDKNGEICRRFNGVFKDGLPSGRGDLTGCDDNRILETGIFDNGSLLSGHRFTYSRRGQKITESEIENSARHGQHLEYSPNNGALIRQVEYYDGSPHGSFLHFYPVSGQLQRSGAHNVGKLRGAVRHYFYDGIVKGVEGIYRDVKLPSRKTKIDATSTLMHDYERFDRLGRGQLVYFYDGLFATPTYNRIIEVGQPVTRQFDHENGDAHVTEGTYSTYYFNDGSVLISEFGEVPGVASETIETNFGETTIWRRPRTGLFGNYILERTDGGILNGEIRNGTIDGRAIFRTPKGETQSVEVVDGTWTWTWTEEVKTGRDGPLTSIGKATVKAISDAGGEFERWMCNLVGSEPGEGCSVGGGGNCDTDGNCTATDSEGTPVGAGPREKPGIPDGALMREVDIDGIAGEMEDGIWRMIASTEADLGLPWPGLTAGQSVYIDTEWSLRSNDSYGAGEFWAERSRVLKDSEGNKIIERYRHVGQDWEAVAGSDMLSPVTGTVVRVSNVYTSDNRGLRNIVIENGGYETKIMYVRPNVLVGPGAYVVAGETTLGTVQDLSVKYPNITNHVHIQIGDPGGGYYPSNGALPLRRLKVLNRN